MTRLTFRVTLGVLLAASAVFAQATAPARAFEVATIKPSAPMDAAAMRAGTAHVGTKVDGGRVDIGTASLFRLICMSWQIAPYQVSGPGWLKSTNFDIQAKIPDGSTADQIPEMMRTLLQERFGLKFHRDSKDQSVYALVVAKGGPKLKVSAPDSAPPAAAETPKPAVSMSLPTAQGVVKLVRTAQGLSIEMPDGEISGKLNISINPTQPPTFHLESAGITMKTFAAMLSVGVVDRPVVDMTGLMGTYDVGVDLSAEDAMNVARAATDIGAPRAGGDSGGAERPAVASDPSGASVITSIQNLGLRLEPRKLPLDLLVVDRVEKTPTGN